MSKITKLKFSDIKKDIKVFDELRKVTLSNGKYININIRFSPTKKIELIKQLVADAVLLSEIDPNNKLAFSQEWIMFNVMCKFSELGTPPTLDERLDVYSQVLDWECFGEILKEYPRKELENLFNSITAFTSEFNERIAQLKDEDMTVEQLIEEIVSEQEDTE